MSAEVAGWDGYFVGVDWRALKLTKVRFAFQVSLDDHNWIAVPAGGYEGSLMVLPTLASAPRAVSAVAGDRRATVKWTPPANPGSARITSYTVSSVPGGRTCVTIKTSCVVAGLSNQTAYRFRVVAKTAVGSSPYSTLSAPVVPKPYVSVTVKPKSNASKLKVDVNPNKGSGYWTFTVQKQTSGGAWSKVDSYRTKGKKETRTINLPQGTYRVVVAAKYGYQATTSGSVYLKK